MSFYSKHLNNYLDAMHTHATNKGFDGGFAQLSLGKATAGYGGIGGVGLGVVGAGIGYGMSDRRNDYTLEGGLLGAGLGTLGGVGFAIGNKSMANNLFRGMQKYGDDWSLVGHELHNKGKELRKGFWEGLNEVYPTKFD